MNKLIVLLSALVMAGTTGSMFVSADSANVPCYSTRTLSYGQVKTNCTHGNEYLGARTTTPNAYARVNFVSGGYEIFSVSATTSTWKYNTPTLKYEYVHTHRWDRQIGP